MILCQTYDIAYTPKYTYLKLIIDTNQGWLVDVAHRTVVHSYWLDLGSELQIQVMEFLFDNA